MPPFRASPLGTTTVACPVCAEDVEVDLVADDGVIKDGNLQLTISARYHHGCLNG